MVILASPAGNEIKRMQFGKIDVDLNKERDFEMRLPVAHYTEEIKGKGRLFVPGTEFGGMVGGIRAQTATDEIIVTGRTWRGILAKKVIKPPAGQSHKIVSGDVGAVIGNLIKEQGLEGLFFVPPEAAGVAVQNYQFDRYITLLSGIEKMLKAVNCRVNLQYVQQEQGLPGYVELSIAPIQNLSQQIELSQDSRLDFTFSETKNGVNHLICLGKGELTDRVVVDLYIQQDGSIGSTQYYSGLDEVAEVYEDTSAEDQAALTERGTEKLEALASRQEFEMSVDALGIQVNIGDIIGGRDYITGMYMEKPVTNKIYTEENGIAKIEYEIEGDEQ